MITMPVRKNISRKGAIWILTSVIFLPCFAQNHSARKISQEQADRLRLTAILRKSSEYCRKLERAALDFVCLEEVIERFDRTREASKRYMLTDSTGRFRGMEAIPWIPGKLESRKYLYDYQFVGKNRKIEEKRNLMETNGKKIKIQGSSLLTTKFEYQHILFGPIGLLSEFWQSYHVYKLIGEDTVNREKAVVIEATPGPSLTGAHSYGRIWIKEDDGSVLKIIWDQRSIGNFKIIENRAKELGLEPQLTSISEYGFEKNGVRFPSRDYTEEAYIKKDGKKYVEAETTVIYKDYKLFVVETDINY